MFIFNVCTTQKISTPSTEHLSGENQATPDDGIVGIDLGIKDFAVTSEGEVIDNPKFLRNSTDRLKVLQRRASKKQKGSNNRKKANKRVALKHEKIRNQRQDFLHKVSSRLVSENQTICLGE